MPHACDIDVYWSDRPGGHDDIIVRFGDHMHRCDSYYFAIRAEQSSDSTSARDVFRFMCQRFLKEIDRRRDSNWTLHFPFDLSDQCIGWFRADRYKNDIELSIGWSSDEGHGFVPSHSPFPTEVKEWSVICGSRTTGLDSLIACFQELVGIQKS